MASKKPKYNPDDVERWVTVRGARIPIMKDGSFGVGTKEDKKSAEEYADELVESKEYVGDRSVINQIESQLRGMEGANAVQVDRISVTENKDGGEYGYVDADYRMRFEDENGRQHDEYRSDQFHVKVRNKLTSQNARYDTSRANGAKKPSKPKNGEDAWMNFMTAEDRRKVAAALNDTNIKNAVVDNRKHGEKMESVLGKVWMAMQSRDSAKPIRQLPKDLKNLKKGEYFTKKDIDEPKESQVWVRGEWIPSAKAYSCHKFSDVNSESLLKSDAEVWTDFYF